jgi:hypothetical protein
MAKITTFPRRTRRHVLAPRQSLVLENAQGTIVAVDRGCIWVTLENDTRDLVLTQGMRLQVDRSGRTIIAAEAPTTLRLLVPERLADRVAASSKRALARWLSGRDGRLARRAVPYF